MRSRNCLYLSHVHHGAATLEGNWKHDSEPSNRTLNMSDFSPLTVYVCRSISGSPCVSISPLTQNVAGPDGHLTRWEGQWSKKLVLLFNHERWCQWLCRTTGDFSSLSTSRCIGKNKHRLTRRIEGFLAVSGTMFSYQNYLRLLDLPPCIRGC